MELRDCKRTGRLNYKSLKDYIAAEIKNLPKSARKIYSNDYVPFPKNKFDAYFILRYNLGIISDLSGYYHFNEDYRRQLKMIK